MNTQIHPDLLGDFEVTARAIWQGLEIAYGIAVHIDCDKPTPCTKVDTRLRSVRREVAWMTSPQFVEMCERIGISPAWAHERANAKAKEAFRRAA